MNLPLHFGLVGALEAGLIALAMGFLIYMLWSRFCRWRGLGLGHAVGWAALATLVAAAGIDAWNLFYIGIVRLESPLYARIALSSIHDPDFLGTRVSLEILFGLLGVVLGWLTFTNDKPIRLLATATRDSNNT